MTIVKRYFMLWLIFSLLSIFAVLGLELLEGDKMTTSEYDGLRNLGFTFIQLIALTSIAMFVVTFLPLTVIMNKWMRPLAIRMLLYSAAGGAGGIWVFKRLYGFAAGYEVERYDLQINTAILLFGLAGFIYAITDYYLHQKRKRSYA